MATLITGILEDTVSYEGNTPAPYTEGSGVGLEDPGVLHGELVDHLIIMRRMPEDRRLSDLLVSGADVDDHLRAIARTVAVFHAGLAPITDDDTIAAIATPPGTGVTAWATAHTSSKRTSPTSVPRSVRWMPSPL